MAPDTTMPAPAQSSIGIRPISTRTRPITRTATVSTTGQAVVTMTPTATMTASPSNPGMGGDSIGRPLELSAELHCLAGPKTTQTTQTTTHNPDLSASCEADPFKYIEPIFATETLSMRLSRKMAELSQTSLDFSHLAPVGRDKEMRVLDRALQYIIKSAEQSDTLPSSSSHSNLPDIDDEEDEDDSTILSELERHSAMRANRSTNKSTNNGSSPSAQSADGHKAASTTHDKQTAQSAWSNARESRSSKGSSASHISGEEASATNSVRSFISISGYSGTGKSALAASLRPKCKANNIFFITGKFDLKQMDEPYSGFRAAMADLCTQICHLPKFQSVKSMLLPQKTKMNIIRRKLDTRCFDDIQGQILQGLKPEELRALAKLIPNLVDIVGPDALAEPTRSNGKVGDNTANASSPRRTLSYQGYREQSVALKLAFRHFIQVICNSCPLVWVSDDVQWADKESLDLIESLVLDTDISSLMLVVCYRSNQATAGVAQGADTESVPISSASATSSQVTQMLTAIQSKKRERYIRYVNLDINNLSLQHVHDLLRQLLKVYSFERARTDKCWALAEIVFKRTNGNVFFTQQFARMLVNDKLLSFDLGSMQWVWDNDRIRRETPATMNVVELMELKLQQIDTAQYMLPLAACLGSTFSWLLLRTALQGFSEGREEGHLAFYEALFGGPPPSDGEEWVAILAKYEEEGLIEAHAAVTGGISMNYKAGCRDLDSVYDSIYDFENGTKDGNNDDDDEEEDEANDNDNSKPNNKLKKPTVAANYSFIHDKVQEAALRMIPSKVQLAELQHRIGLILMDRLSRDEFAPSQFVVANLLNSRLDLVPPYPPSLPSQPSSRLPSPLKLLQFASLTPTPAPSPLSPLAPEQSKDDAETDVFAKCTRFRIAKLNFDAGIKAASHGAFQAAFLYLQNSINMMPPNHWQTHYDMSLELFTSATECACVSHKFDEMQKYGNEVINQDDLPMLDKMRAYHVLMDGEITMVRHSKNSDMLKLGTEVLAKFGYRYPKNSMLRLIALVLGIVKLKRSAKKWTVGYLNALKPAKDPMKECIMKTLDRHAMATLLADPDIQPLVMIDAVNEAMVDGTTAVTPSAIINLAVIVGPILGDMDAAKVYANYAVKKTAALSDKQATARALVSSHSFVLNNVMLYEKCKQPVLNAHSTAMTHGDVQIAFWAAMVYLDLCFFTARPLPSMDVDYSKYTKAAADFQQKKIVGQLSTRWQLILNLRGRSQHRTLLVGDAFDEVAAMRRIEEAKDVSSKVDLLQSRLFIAVYFSDFESAIAPAMEVFDSQAKSLPGYVSTMPSIFFTAFVTMIVCKENKRLSRSKRNKIKQLHRRARKAFQAAVESGNPNASHYNAILEAERMSLKSHETKPDEKREEVVKQAVQMYENAIRMSARAGLIQDQALASERLARHMQMEDDMEGAQHRFNEAIRLYGEWGAGAKVAQLQQYCQSFKQSDADQGVTG